MRIGIVHGAGGGSVANFEGKHGPFIGIGVAIVGIERNARGFDGDQFVLRFPFDRDVERDLNQSFGKEAVLVREERRFFGLDEVVGFAIFAKKFEGDAAHIDARGILQLAMAFCSDEVFFAGAVGGLLAPGGLLADEIQLVRQVVQPKFKIVTPGIRLPDQSLNDQQRIATPREAVSSGADYIVVGRAVTDHANPRSAMQHLLDTL